jgi:hypothetical protein
MRYRIFSSIVFLMASQAAWAVDSGLAFLKISPDAASTALGDPAVVLLSSPLASMANPALLPFRQGNRAALSNVDWIFDSKMKAAALELKLSILSFAFDVRSFESDHFELREDSSPEAQGEFAVSNWAAGGALGINLSALFDEGADDRLNTGLTAGVALRRMQEKIYNVDSKGWAMDLGLAWQQGSIDLGLIQADQFRLAWAMKHIGKMSEFVEDAPDLPMTQSFGVAFENLHTPLPGSSSIFAEMRYLKSDGHHLHLGMEWQAFSMLALRTGVMTGYDERSFSAGFAFFWQGMHLDYAWQPFDGGLEDSFKFTFSFAL